MKNGKRLTVADRKYLSLLNMNAANWLISKRESHEWELVHRETGRVKTIPAP